MYYLLFPSGDHHSGPPLPLHWDCRGGSIGRLFGDVSVEHLCAEWKHWLAKNPTEIQEQACPIAGRGKEIFYVK